MQRPTWMLALDLDGTLWTHLNVTGMEPPFRASEPWVLVDSRGQVLRLYTYMVDLIRWAKSRGALVASLSWNDTEKALLALKTLGLEGLFDIHAIALTPCKGCLLSSALKKLDSTLGFRIEPHRIVYIDDRDIHLHSINMWVGPVKFIRAHRDCWSLKSCISLIEGLLSRCTGRQHYPRGPRR